MTRAAMTSAADYTARGPAAVDTLMRRTGLSEAEARAMIAAADDRADSMAPPTEPDPYGNTYRCNF